MLGAQILNILGLVIILFKLYIYIQIIIKISRETILKVFIIDPPFRLCVSLNTHSRYVLELLDPSRKELCHNLLKSPYYWPLQMNSLKPHTNISEKSIPQTLLHSLHSPSSNLIVCTSDILTLSSEF